MIHKFYNSNNICKVFLSPYCKIIENTDSRIIIINRITNQIITFKGADELLDVFRKSFLLNIGMKYEELEEFFAGFEDFTPSTWKDLIQGGFFE